MARREADREDLFAEAAALVERAELQTRGRPEPVTAGRRKTGGWSVYFGADPCFHFDEKGRLRRAFAQGRLYRTQGHTLAELQRLRTPDETQLRRRDLSPAELTSFLEQAHRRLAELLDAIRTDGIQLRRVVPVETPFLRNLEQALMQILHPALRLAPPVHGRS